MDPNANLTEQLVLAGKLNNGIGWHVYSDLASYEADVDRLCELVESLDKWLKTGGHLPDRWQRGRAQ